MISYPPFQAIKTREIAANYRYFFQDSASMAILQKVGKFCKFKVTVCLLYLNRDVKAWMKMFNKTIIALLN